MDKYRLSDTIDSIAKQYRSYQMIRISELRSLMYFSRALSFRDENIYTKSGYLTDTNKEIYIIRKLIELRIIKRISRGLFKIRPTIDWKNNE